MQPTLADVADAPTWLPTAPELDELEVALLGLADEVTLAVPVEVAAAAAVGGGLVLTDPEGTPLALLAVEPATTSELAGSPGGSVPVTGRIAALQPAEHGPFRRLRRSPSELRSELRPELAGRPVVAVLLDGPPTHADIARLITARDGVADGGRPAFVLLPLIGAGYPRVVDASALIRMSLAVADDLHQAIVVPVPLTRGRADDKARRAAVAEAYGATEVVDLSGGGDGVGHQLLTRLDGDAPLDDLVNDAVARELRRSYRRPYEQGLVVFFTGLSGSGKSTVARAFTDAIGERVGRSITLLDGDVVRRMLFAGLTFSRADRELNIRRIGFVAAEIARHGGLAVCCPIAPYASTRAEVRRMVEAVGVFVLVHISTPLEECERRDRKGLYAKARAGLIPEFTGISDPYEAPTDADLAIDTTHVSVDDAVTQVLDLLHARGLLRPADA
jgi:sulfate adenylyltransferase